MIDLEDKMKNKRHLRSQRGINLISVMLATLIMSAAAFAILGVLNTSFHSGRSAEPKSIAQTTVSNFQTDLNAMAMYDSNVVARIGAMQSGTSTDITPPTAPTGVQYMPADTQAIKITVQQITSNSNSAQLVVNYQVPSGTPGAAALSGNSTITVTQKAPNACDTNLAGRVSGC